MPPVYREGGFLRGGALQTTPSLPRRYNEQYAVSMACEGRCLDTAMLARACLPRPHAFRLVRHAVAAHVLVRGHGALQPHS